eukprot:gene11015-19858_t
MTAHSIRCPEEHNEGACGRPRKLSEKEQIANLCIEMPDFLEANCETWVDLFGSHLFHQCPLNEESHIDSILDDVEESLLQEQFEMMDTCPEYAAVENEVETPLSCFCVIDQKKCQIQPNEQEVDLNETESPYRSVQAMGKAMTKVRTSLPKSPKKRKAVAAALAKEIGINVVKAKKRAAQIGLNEDTKSKIIDFYLRDDISWQAPGKKDHVIIRSKDASGKKLKIHMQCKYMLMSLAEAHQLYLRRIPSLPLVEVRSNAEDTFSELFPGEITEFGGIDSTEVRADVMEKTGRFWKWSFKRDNIF